MKLNNFKNSRIRLYVSCLFILLFLITIILVWFFKIKINPQLDMIVIAVSILGIGVFGFTMFSQESFTYDSTSEVISISNIPFYRRSYVRKSIQFELPKTQIINYSIENNGFQQFLKIKFNTSSGKFMQRYFNISACNKYQIKALKTDLEISLSSNGNV